MSCNHTTKTIDNVSEKQNDIDYSLISGYWIMSNYIDSILQNKSIEEHSRKRMAWSAIILHIKEDTLKYYGLIRGNNKLKFSNNYDSLAVIKEMGEYQLSYDKKNDIIRAKCIKDYYETKDSIRYLFRRIKESEQRLIKGIDNKPFFKKLKPNFYSFFIDSLICGEYKPLTNSTNLPTLKLKPKGLLNGFLHYNKYFIHDYFGTLHPYTPEDAIIFIDTTIVNERNEPPTNIGIYSWEFNGDTLVLTEMLTETYDSYYKGTKKYKYIKTANKR
jgi:hypothetical protein